MVVFGKDPARLPAKHPARDEHQQQCRQLRDNDDQSLLDRYQYVPGKQGAANDPQPCVLHSTYYLQQVLHPNYSQESVIQKPGHSRLKSLLMDEALARHHGSCYQARPGPGAVLPDEPIARWLLLPSLLPRQQLTDVAPRARDEPPLQFPRYQDTQ